VIVVIGRVSCAVENRDALIAALERMQEASRKEDGCIRYGFFAAVEEPTSFIAVEEWADRSALDRHFQQAHLAEFAKRLGELVSERPEVAIHEVADTKPFPREAGHS
jgi:quinol monooxygenase YgiN